MNKEEFLKELEKKKNAYEQLYKEEYTVENRRKIDEIYQWYIHAFDQCDDSCFIKIRLKSDTRTMPLFQEFAESDYYGMILSNEIYLKNGFQNAKLVIIKDNDFHPSNRQNNIIKMEDGEIFTLFEYTITGLKIDLLNAYRHGKPQRSKKYYAMKKILCEKIEKGEVDVDSNMIFFDEPIFLTAITLDGKIVSNIGGCIYVDGYESFKIIGVRF